MNTSTMKKPTQPHLLKVEQVAIQNDLKILNELGFDVNLDGSIKCECPIHGGDNPSGFTYDPNINRWRCWTHNCHDKYGTGLIGLVRSMTNKKLSEACNYILQKCGVSNIEKTDNDDTDLYINQQAKRQRMKYESKEYDDSVVEGVKKLDHSVEYFLQRGFSEEILNKFDAFLCTTAKNSLYGRACLPIYNIHDQLAGFGGRKTELIDSDMKWYYLPTGIKLGLNLFGINLAKKLIQQTHSVILVEGPGDVMKMHQAGICNCVSPFSNKISHDQIKILMAVGATEVICAFDNDEAGNIGYENVRKQCASYFNVKRIELPKGKDPGDLTVEEIHSLFKG